MRRQLWHMLRRPLLAMCHLFSHLAVRARRNGTVPSRTKLALNVHWYSPEIDQGYRIAVPAIPTIGVFQVNIFSHRKPSSLAKLIGILALAIFAIFFSTPSARSQSTSGDLVGVVKDPSGAVVPNASVTVTSESTGVSVSVKSGSAGEYRAGNLLPATYDIVVSMTGFQPYTLRGVSVELNKTATAIVTLSLGTSTNVEITADSGVVLDTTSTNLTMTFSNQELSELPTASIGGAGQSGVLNMSLLSPGIASSGGLGIGVGPSVGGQRPRNNNFELEGVDNNNKAITGPLVYLPNDAVGNFTLITNQFSPEFGHSSGGQFNTTVLSGNNTIHGRLYEYFQNRNLDAASGVAGGKIPNPKYDNNRYGGQIGGPILKDKLFAFANYERNTIGENQSGYVCAPTTAGFAMLDSLKGSFSANNLAQYKNYVPTANYLGGAQVTDANDNACFTGSSGPQALTVTDGAGTAHSVPVGNYQINAAAPTLFNALTTSLDYNITAKDSLRLRYMYDTETSTDTSLGISLPAFYVGQPFKWHLFALSEYHTFTPNLTNEFRVGFNRYANTLGAGNFSFPGLDSFPTIQFFDQGDITVGPDGNAPQFTIQNLYQVTDNVSYVKGKHTIKIGFDGRKYISPQGFTQRARGDYEYAQLDQYLHDLAPDSDGFAERSTGSTTYYGDQTALYFYGNDTWRLSPTITINAGLRYEFTSVPAGERTQQFNKGASVAGLVSFTAPQPTYTAFAPRFGINYSPDSKTSVRAGFGIAYDVLFDNLGTLSFPPQLSSTTDVGGNGPAYGSPNFLANGGLPAGSGVAFQNFSNLADQRAATSAYLPNQVLPYAETYTLTIQRTIGSSFTAEIGYVGTRGIHLPTQDQINKQPKATAANQLPTFVNGSANIVPSGQQTSTLAAIQALSNVVPAWKAAGFTSTITSYQPFSGSNYNALEANLTRRFQKGLQMNLSYTWSKTMDNATDEVFATVLTPRRPQNSQCVSCDYSRSALDRTHRITLEVLYDLPYYKHSDNFIKKNVIGNWTVTPIYTYESPEYATVLSGTNSNLNGDSGSAIDRPNINPNGIKGTSSKVVPIVGTNLIGTCDATDDSGGPATITQTGAANGNYNVCPNDTIGYSAGSLDSTGAIFTPSNAYYVQAGPGTAPTASRNTLPIRPINNIDLAVYKRIGFRERYSLEIGAQAFNVVNHAQYIPGSVNNVNGPSYTSSYAFQTAGSGAFNHPEKIFLNNARTMQLTGKINF